MGQDFLSAYWRHLSESTSQKSITRRASRWWSTYCAIGDENTITRLMPCAATVCSTQRAMPASW